MQLDGPTNYLSSIIIPPPEIRKAADKTAEFVAKNGFGFEERLRETHQEDPKFSFLNANDPYHEYYQKQIEDIKEGKVQVTVPKNAQPIVAKKQKQVPPKPQPFEFYSEMPSISKQDL